VNKKIPTECHLYWVQSGNYGSFTLHTNKGMGGYHEYTWLAAVPVDFGDVEFDEKELTLKALNQELGVAQGKVNEIKDKIQKLLAIEYDDPNPADLDSFGDDTPF